MLLNDGLATMAVGMGTVFCFLVILWAVVAFLGIIVAYLNKLFPAEVQAVKTAVKTAVGDLEVAVAVAAAKLKK